MNTVWPMALPTRRVLGCQAMGYHGAYRSGAATRRATGGALRDLHRRVQAEGCESLTQAATPPLRAEKASPAGRPGTNSKATRDAARFST